MSSGNLQGWSRDPFGLHEARYFSAGRPTKLVRDGTVDSYDEPPSGHYEPAGAAAPDSAPGPRPAAVPRAPAAAAPWPALQARTPAGQARRPAGQARRPAGQARRPAGQARRPAGGSVRRASANGGPPPGRYPPAGQSRMLSPKVFVAIVVLAVLTVAGIVAKASESGSAPRKPAVSPTVQITAPAG